MMMLLKKRANTIFCLFLLGLLTSYAQSENTQEVTDQQRLQSTLLKAKEIGLSAEKTNQIKTLYTSLLDSLAVYQKEQQLFADSAILYLNEHQKNETNARLEFRKTLTNVIDINEFDGLFGAQFERRIKNETAKRYDEFTEKYSLSSAQKQKAKQLIYANVKHEILTWAYYTYDPAIGYEKTSSAKALSKEKENALLAEFGLLKKAAVTSPKIKYLVDKAKVVNMTVPQIDSLLHLLAVRDDRIEAYPSFWAKGNNKYAIHYIDKSLRKEEAQRQFQEDLVKVMSFNQFSYIFEEQFMHRIQQEADLKLDRLTRTYEFKEKQLTTLKKVLYDNAAREVLTENYYTYDSEKAYTKLLSAKDQSAKTLKELFNKFRIKWKASTYQNPKIQLLVDRASKIGLSESQIERLLVAVAKRDDQVAAYPNIWASNNEKYVLNFHDQSTSKEEAHRRFKQDLARTLSTKQFEELFILQLQPIIDRQVTNHLKKSKDVYRFGPLEESELRQLLKKHYTNRVVYTEYYEYDWTLRTQKIKVLDFRFQKEYRKMIEAFKNKKSE